MNDHKKITEGTCLEIFMAAIMILIVLPVCIVLNYFHGPVITSTIKNQY